MSGALGVLLAHLVGDYLLQSDWMANEKTKRRWPAWAHAITYGLPFLLVTHPRPRWRSSSSPTP